MQFHKKKEPLTQGWNIFLPSDYSNMKYLANYMTNNACIQERCEFSSLVEKALPF